MNSFSPSRKQAIKLVSFDFDGTLIEGNSWTLFNEACGLDPDIDKEYYRQYHAGEITYEEWIQALVDIWKQKGTVTQELGEAVSNKCVFRDGVLETLTYLREKMGYRIVVTTGGVDIVVRPFLEKYGMTDIVFTHRSVFEDGVFVGCVNQALPHETHKAGICKLSVFKQFLEKERIGFDACAHIGDGANDMEIFSKVAKPFFLDAGTALGEVPYTTIKHMNELKELL